MGGWGVMSGEMGEVRRGLMVPLFFCCLGSELPGSRGVGAGRGLFRGWELCVWGPGSRVSLRHGTHRPSSWSKYSSWEQL